MRVPQGIDGGQQSKTDRRRIDAHRSVATARITEEDRDGN